MKPATAAGPPPYCSGQERPTDETYKQESTHGHGKQGAHKQQKHQKGQGRVPFAPSVTQVHTALGKVNKQTKTTKRGTAHKALYQCVTAPCRAHGHTR